MNFTFAYRKVLSLIFFGLFFLLLFGSCSLFRSRNCIPCPQWSYEIQKEKEKPVEADAT